MSKYSSLKKYNDYELLYLINDGSEYALNLFFEKYDLYISKFILEFVSYYNENYEDLVQEGRMILFRCIKMYEPNSNTSFFTYFTVSLKRKILKLLYTEYNYLPIVSEDLVLYRTAEQKTSISGDMFFSDPEKIKIFDCLIIGDMSVRQYSIINKVSYDKVYLMKKKVIEELRRMFGVK